MLRAGAPVAGSCPDAAVEALNKGYGPAGDALAPTEGAETLWSGGLDTHRSSHGGAQSFFHVPAVGGEARSVEHHGAVGVAGPEAGFGEPAHDLGQHRHAVGTRPGRIRVGKMGSQVAETSGAEKGVGHGVSNDVGIAVTGQSPIVVFEGDTSQDEAA